MPARLNPELACKLRHIKLIITDVDGVLTDGGLYYGPDGECLKRFHAHDGLGVRLLQQAGTQVAVLSGRDCPALRRRLAARADASNILIVGLDGEVSRAKGQTIKPGDRILVMPRFDSKNLQPVKNVTQVLYQMSVLVKVAVGL